MRKWLFFLSCIIPTAVLFGQDGSDIRYLDTEKFDKSYIGRLIQIDYYNKSNIIKTTWDTVEISIGASIIKFAEHREDDGLNNWFYGQYLKSTEYANGYKVRLVKSRVDDVTNDYIQVTEYFDFFSKNNILLAGKRIQVPHRISKKIVSQVIIKVEKTDM